MKYGDQVRRSFVLFWKNQALLSVLLLEFIFTVLVGFLCFFCDAALLMWLNRTAVINIMQQSDTLDWRMLMNSHTIVVLVALLLVQGVLFVYFDSFFKAGFYGMLKNCLQDGSTKFNEFMPSAKRYWYAMFRLQFVRSAILVVVCIPFIIAAVMVTSTTPQFVTSQQHVMLYSTLGAAVCLMLIVLYWLLYSEAVLVFDDLNASQAIKISSILTQKNVGKSLLCLVTFLLMILAGIVVATILTAPFEYMEFMSNSLLWSTMTQVVSFILNIITIGATVIGNIFIFLSYSDVSSHAPMKKSVIHKKKSS